MDFVEWRFAYYENQFPAFFQNDIRCTMDQIVSVTAGDRPQRSHTAWNHHHSVGQERAARNRCAGIALLVAETRHLPDLLDPIGCFMHECSDTPSAHDEVSFNPCAVRKLQQTHGQDRSRRPSYAHDYLLGRILIHMAGSCLRGYILAEWSRQQAAQNKAQASLRTPKTRPWNAVPCHRVSPVKLALPSPPLRSRT